jgi:DNA-cytosine methyltransferase
MTKFKEWPDATIDVLVGGTPCQSFSVAGLRKGLDDPRGNLMLTYLAIAAKYRPTWVLWENVPGVLSSNGGRDFATFLRGLAECGYGYSYRVLDAQFTRTPTFPRAVPQRRRRVFVVGHLGSWQRAAAVLFERHSLSGHPAPSRKKGEEPSATIAARFEISRNNHEECVAQTLLARDGGFDLDVETPVVCADVAPTLDTSYATKLGQDNQHINGGGGIVCQLQDA